MFNKSQVMRRAHSIRKETGCTMSDALRKAWVEVKRLAVIEDQLFDLNMVDRRNDDERTLAVRLGMERADLNRKLNPKSAEEIAAQEEKNRLARQRWEEAEELRFQLGCIVRSKNPDWELHKTLHARLKEIA